MNHGLLMPFGWQPLRLAELPQRRVSYTLRRRVVELA
jgi:hypothetical protein